MVLGVCIQSFLRAQARLAAKTKTYRFIVQYYGKKFLSALNQRFPEIATFYRHRFPGVALRHKLDNWDYVLNFSSEILVGILVVTVALINVGVFKFSAAKDFTYNDSSLAAKLLKNHAGLNLALYTKENTVKTTVSQDGFIPRAYADTTLSTLTDLEDGSGDNGSGEDSTFNNNIMVKPNPDSVRDLVSKQVIIYETQGGDTLSSIAQKFNISVSTIKWANNLPSDTVKPGWFLKILPVNGVLYQVDSNDTLPDIADYFHGNMEDIIAYNALAGAESINEGDWIIIPDGVVPAPPAPAPAATPQAPAKKVATRTSAGTPIIFRPAGGGHKFPKGYCTYYVASKRKITFGGNAIAWLKNGRAAGYPTGSEPRAGAVMVSTESPVGHVAYVESVGDDYFTVSEMNYVGFNRVSTRKIPKGSRFIKGFIY